MVAEWLVALSLLAPVEPADPAPVTFPVAIDTKTTLPDGRILSIKGTVQGTIEEPAPLPVQPTITALKNEAGQGVEQIRSGEVLVIEGVKLWQEGTSIRVQLPGRTSTVLSTSPTRITVRFPAVLTAMTGPLQIYHSTSTGWMLVTTGPRITVLPGTAPPGRAPRIRSYHGPDGQPKQTFKPGEPITLRGEGLGRQPGQVWLSQWPAPVLSWSDTAVTVGGYPWATVGQPAWETLWVQVWTSEGQWVDTFSREFDPRVGP